MGFPGIISTPITRSFAGRAVDYNDRLSLQRAERVRGDFIQRGITPDEVPEPRNRRVEINIR